MECFNLKLRKLTALILALATIMSMLVINSLAYGSSDIDLTDVPAPNVGGVWDASVLYDVNTLSIKGVAIHGIKDCPELKNDDTLIIPSTYWGLPVLEIAFSNTSANENLRETRSVVIPEGITTIAVRAFENFKYLENIELPTTLTEIGEYAFVGCPYLGDVVIPNGVTNLSRVFSGSGVRGVTIPASVTGLDEAFYDCRYLSNVTFAENSALTEMNRSFVKCVSLKSIAIPDGVTDLYETFNGCTNLESVTLPKGITVIGKSAFRGCYSLEKVTLPEGLKRIEDYAFNDSKINSIVFPDSISYIGDGAFAIIYGLRSIENLSCNPETNTDLFIGYQALGLDITYEARYGIRQKEVYCDNVLIYYDPDEAQADGNIVTVKDGTRVLGSDVVAFQKDGCTFSIPTSITEKNLYDLFISKNWAITANIQYRGTYEQFIRSYSEKTYNDLKESVDSLSFLEAAKGDVDGDGEVTAADALLMRNYLARVISDDEINTSAADVNGDGKINAKDQLAIRLALMA